MNTVILLHGFTDSPRRVHFMARFFRARGWTVLTPALRPSNGSVALEEMAAMLAGYIEQHTTPGERLDLVGFSMGGLVCRYYLQVLGGAGRCDRFVSIASPHHGTRVARLLPGAGMTQMRPQSAFLDALNRDVSALERVACTVFYTPFDFVIVPASSSILPFATVMRFRIFSHVLMLYHPAVWKTLAAVLSEPLC